MNPEKRTILPKVAFTGFAARYREPRIEEGFQDMTKVDFTVRLSNRSDWRDRSMLIISQFEGTEEQKAQWTKYWIS